MRAYHLAKKRKIPAALYAQQVGLVYEFLGNYRVAERWLLRGFREGARDFGPFLNLVVFYRLIGNFEKAKRYAHRVEKLYEKESESFKKTLWGKKIRDVIASAGSPLPIVTARRRRQPS